MSCADHNTQRAGLSEISDVSSVVFHEQILTLKTSDFYIKYYTYMLAPKNNVLFT